MNRYRKPLRIVPSKRVLILCEGESEQRYLINYKTLPANRDRLRYVQIEIYKPQDHSPLGLVNQAKSNIREAIKDKLPYYQVWVIFDKDGHANISNAFEEAARFNPVINIGFTARCFENWILLHFERVNRAFEKCDDVISKLSEKHCPNYRKMYLGSNIFDNLESAIANSEWLMERNSNDLGRGMREYELDCYTSLHTLMKFLKSL